MAVLVVGHGCIILVIVVVVMAASQLVVLMLKRLWCKVNHL
jgi:hypothetical protein